MSLNLYSSAVQQKYSANHITQFSNYNLKYISKLDVKFLLEICYLYLKNQFQVPKSVLTFLKFSQLTEYLFLNLNYLKVNNTQQVPQSQQSRFRSSIATLRSGYYIEQCSSMVSVLQEFPRSLGHILCQLQVWNQMNFFTFYCLNFLSYNLSRIMG